MNAEDSASSAADDRMTSASSVVSGDAPPVSQMTTQPDISSSELSSASEDNSEAKDPPPSPAGAVPASAPVSASYFDDAIFFGDSITTGIPLYHVADNAAVVAMTGINTDNINYKQVIDDGNGGRITVLEDAKKYVPRAKVYIMLGGNGIGFDKKTFVSGYKTFLDSIKELFPDATIYLQSMTPVTADYVNQFDPELDNDKIDAYNLEILALAQQEGVYYLDVASVFKDETGALPKEASPMDGMHFTPEYYTKWFDYLKTHTVKELA